MASPNSIKRDLVLHGFTVAITGGQHIKITHPDMDGIVYASLTPSCRRAHKNMWAMIRRRMKVKQ